MIVFVAGLPGSGKSYFAKKLAEILHAEYLSSDKLRKELFTQLTYSDSEKAAVYKNMLEKMEKATAQNKNVVLDATFHKKSRRDLFSNHANDAIHFIEIRADKEIIKERLEKPRPHSDADYRVHQKIKKEWEPLAEEHLQLHSTNNNIDQMLGVAIKYLKDDEKGN